MRVPVLAAWLLVFAGLVRAFLLVGHTPLAGYANQYDMVRTSACIGYYPALPEPARYEAHPQAPIATYRRGESRPDVCYPSTEVAIAAAAAQVSAWVHGNPDILSLRVVGYAKLAMLALTVLLLAWALSPHPAAAILHGLAVAFVLCDPVTTLWMNTLYTEFGAIWGLYAVLGALAALALTERRARLTGALLLVGLAALAFSREQFALLPPALVLAAAPWLWYRSRRLAVAALCVALAATAASFVLVGRPPGIREANRTDTYLGLVLPSSDDPVGAMKALGLPERCGAMMGATWYLQRGEDVRQACPEALRLPSTAFLRLLPGQPETLLRSAARAAPTLAALSPPYVGILAGTRFATIEDLPWWLQSPLAELVPRLPLDAFQACLLAGLLAAPLALLAALGWARPRSALHGTGVLTTLLLGLVVAYVFGTTVFGDGWAESARHFLPGSLALATLALGTPVAIGAVATTADRRWRMGVLEIASALVAFAAIATLALVLGRWSASQPLAIGVLDEPAVRAIKGDLHVRGWALDPEGTSEIELRLGVGVHKATLYGDQPRDALTRHYPAYPDAGRARFSVDISAADLASAGPSGETQMRTLITNRRGIVTEIDRRRIVLEP